MKKGDDPIEANHAEQQFTKYIRIYYTKSYMIRISWGINHRASADLRGLIYKEWYSVDFSAVPGLQEDTLHLPIAAKKTQHMDSEVVLPPASFQKKKFLISNARWSLLESNPVIGTCPQRWWHRFPSFLSILSTYKINYE